MPCTCSRRPSAVRHRMKPLLLGSAALMLSGCVDQADWSVVTANSEDFKACLQNPSVTWLQQAADPSLRASVGPAITEPASFDARTGIPPQNAFAATLERTQQGALRVGDSSLARMASADEAFVRQRDESAEAATRVLYHPVQGTIDQMVTDVAAGRPVSVTFGASEIREYAARAREAVDKNGWETLAESQAHYLAGDVGAGGIDRIQLQQGLRTVLFVASYLKAYFRGGHIVSVDLKANAVNQLKDILGDDITEELRDELQAILDQVTDKSIFKLGDLAFVSRGGGNRQFPGFNASWTPGAGKPTLEPTFQEIPISDVGADIVRVTLEAIFDSLIGLPAVSNATGVSLVARVEGTDLPIGLPDFAKLDEPPYKVPFDEGAFNNVDEQANHVEGIVKPPLETSLIGISLFGTNNELIANLIATTIAVSARKVVEYTAWCYEYARAQQQGVPDRVVAAADVAQTTPTSLTAAITRALTLDASIGARLETVEVEVSSYWQ